MNLVYPPNIECVRWEAVGPGGLSGAPIFRGTTSDGRVLCRKAHSRKHINGRQLERVHGWMRGARAAGLAFVPKVESTLAGETWTFDGNYLWEIIEWLPGRADFQADPSDARLSAALDALARLHEVWGRDVVRRQACPGVFRRIEVLIEWQRLVGTGWRPKPSQAPDPIWPIAERAWRLLPLHLKRAASELGPWSQRPVPVQPCHCDPWHGNLLFEGDQLTGLIDYATAKVDHVAVDLARMLGSLLPRDRARRERAIADYNARVQRPVDASFVHLLDETGLISAIANWLRWLYFEGRPCPDREVVAARLNTLVERLEYRS